jgi:isopenicillin-N epimerase
VGARLFVVDAITSPTGLVFPVEELVRHAKREGALVLVDAAHAPNHIALGFGALGADWVTGNLHKWMFAARGTAVLWSAPAVQATTHPLVISHPFPQGWPTSFDWTGTRDPTAWLAVPAALAFIDELGAERIASHNRQLCEQMHERLADGLGVAPIAGPSMRGFMAGCQVPGGLPASAAPWLHDELRRRGVQVPIIPWGTGCLVRVSAQLYVDPAWCDPLVEALRILVRIGR